jgi:nucleoside-diphosphate-sugar epimerase
VENVVDANLRACFAEGVAGGVFNVACGTSVSVLQLLRTMAKVLGVKADPAFLPPRPGDVRHSRADIRLAQEKLGYQVLVGFGEGIQKTLQAFLAGQ